MDPDLASALRQLFEMAPSLSTDDSRLIAVGILTVLGTVQGGDRDELRRILSEFNQSAIRRIRAVGN